MSFALLGVISVMALVALVATFMSIKNWHWAQMLLVLGVFLMALTAMFLSAEVLRIHRSLRSGIHETERRIADIRTENEALLTGSSNPSLIGRLFAESPFEEGVEEMPGLDELNHELQLSARRQGRAWLGVVPASGLQNGQIAINVPEGQPPLEPEAIVYVFEMGPPNAANPAQGAQYLGEFRVAAAQGNTATLEPVRSLTERTGQRLQASRGPWRVYETMPADRHEIFAELNDNQLQALLPAASVDEYLRHGGPTTPDDDQYHIAGFDEQGRRVGADELANAAERRYDRTLRAYAYLFEELSRQRVVALAEYRATQEDIRSLNEAHENAKKLTAYREQEITALKSDKEFMVRDRDAILTHLNQLELQLKNAKSLLQQAIDANARLARRLMSQQLSQLQVSTGQ